MVVLSKRRLDSVTIEPLIRTFDNQTPEIGECKVGEQFRAVLNYRVIERTKSFVTLKITYIHAVQTRRKF